MTRKIAAALFIIIVSVAAYIVIRRPITYTPDLKFHIYDDLIIGKTIPSYYNAQCSPYWSEIPTTNCMIRTISGDTEVTQVEGVITDVSYEALGTRAGDLILAWGPPEHIQSQYEFVTMYWHNKIAWSYTKEFTPFSVIEWVDFWNSDTYGSSFPKWKGFGSVTVGK